MKLEELIQNARKEATSPLILELVQEFEEFAQILGKFRSTPEGAGPEEHMAIMKRMSESHDRLQAYFIKVAASYGMTFDQFAQFVGNSSNFEPKAWEEIEKGKKTIAEQLVAQAAPQEKKAKKNLNKNLRI